jgi:hypothetical protein
MYETVVVVTWTDHLWNPNGDITHSIGWLLEAKDRCLRIATEYTDSGPSVVTIPVGLVVDLKLL